MKKKNMFVVALVAFCLTITLFMAISGMLTALAGKGVAPAPEEMIFSTSNIIYKQATGTYLDITTTKTAKFTVTYRANYIASGDWFEFYVHQNNSPQPFAHVNSYGDYTTTITVVGNEAAIVLNNLGGQSDILYYGVVVEAPAGTTATVSYGS